MLQECPHQVDSSQQSARRDQFPVGGNRDKQSRQSGRPFPRIILSGSIRKNAALYRSAPAAHRQRTWMISHVNRLNTCATARKCDAFNAKLIRSGIHVHTAARWKAGDGDERQSVTHRPIRTIMQKGNARVLRNLISSFSIRRDTFRLPITHDKE